jgi:hypothetical protein
LEARERNTDEQALATLPNDSNMDGDDDDWMDMYVFRVSFGVAYKNFTTSTRKPKIRVHTKDKQQL